MRTSDSLLIAASIALACADVPTSHDGGLAFVNATVLPMENAAEALEDATVLVADDRIIDIGSNLLVPDGWETIDASDRYLLPGLVDCHIHLQAPEELTSYLAWGVTSVVHLSGPRPGAPDLEGYRDRIEDGDLLGPTLYLSGPTLDGDPPLNRLSRVVRNPEEASAAIDDYVNAGFDFVKVYNNLQPSTLEATVRAAHARGLRVLGHIPRIAGRADAMERAIAAGLDVVAHSEEFFFSEAYAGVEEMLDRGDVPWRRTEITTEIAKQVAEAGMAVIPNLSFIVELRAQLEDEDVHRVDPESAWLHPEVAARWERSNAHNRSDLERFDRRELAKRQFVFDLTLALHRAGVPLFVGTDASIPPMFPGRSVHTELQALVAAGLSPIEALGAATAAPGDWIHKATERRGRRLPFGTISPGARADLVLVASDPRTDIAAMREIEGVLVRGRWLPRQELENRRQKIAATYLAMQAPVVAD